MVESSSTPASPISSPGPREVVQSFLRLTVDQPDLKKARLHLSRRSQDSALAAPNIPPGTIYTLGAEMADDLGKCIPVSMKNPLPPNAGLQEMTVPVIVVQEEGQWKIDLPATMERLMGSATSALGQAMSAVGDVMSKAMDTVLTAFTPDTPAPTPPPVRVPVAKPKRPAKKPAPKPAAKKVAKKPVQKAAKKTVKKPAQKPAKKPAPKPAKKAARKPKKVAKKKR